jgi:hypothetical protein
LLHGLHLGQKLLGTNRKVGEREKKGGRLRHGFCKKTFWRNSGEIEEIENKV